MASLTSLTATTFNGIIGNTTPAAGNFSTLGASSTATFPTVDIGGGAIDGTTIGASAQAAITGTTVTATTEFVGPVGLNSQSTIGGTVITATTKFAGIVEATSGTSQLYDLNITNGLDLGSKKITNVLAPVSGTDAANKAYVDDIIDGAPVALNTLNELAAALNNDVAFHTTVTTALGNRINKDGSVAMAANLNLTTSGTAYKIVGLADPTANGDAVNKSFFDTNALSKTATSDQSFNSKVTLASGKEVIVAQDPSTANSLARKSYVDGILTSGVNAANGATDAANYAMAAGAFTNTSGTSNQFSAKYYSDNADTVTSTTGFNDVAAQASGGATSNIAKVAGQINPTNNIGTLAGIASDITTCATSAVTSNISTFANTYHIYSASQIGSISTVTAGDLWYNTTSNTLNVTTDGSSWSTVASTTSAIERSEEFVAGTPKTANNGVVYGTLGSAGSGSLTTFPATYSVGSIQVFLNGVLLATTEFTATNGTTVVFPGSGVTSGHVVRIVAFGTFAVSNVYTKGQSDAKYATIADYAPKNDPTFTGTVQMANLNVSGTVTTTNTQTVQIADNILLLNHGTTGSPSENSGFNVVRGDQTNAALIWNETTETFQSGLVGAEKNILVDESNIIYKSVNPDRQTQAATTIDCLKSYNYRVMAAAENFGFSNFAAYNTNGYPISLLFLDRSANGYAPTWTTSGATLVKWATNSEPSWTDHRYWTITFLSDGTNLFASAVGYT